MNRRNEYKELLKQANEELSEYGVRLVLQEDEGYYNLDIYGFKKNDEPEHYAENYEEDELDTLVTEAWHDTLRRAERRENYRKNKEEKNKACRPLEQINRVELLGYVGFARMSKINDREIVKFTMATNRCYRNREGQPVVETQWHNCVAIKNDKVQDLDKIEKGAAVHLFGRIQMQKYTTNTGEEKTVYEIFATRLEVIDKKEPVEYEVQD